VISANLQRVHVLACNLFNWFRLLVHPARVKKEDRYHPSETAEGHRKSDPFNKIYNIQALQQLSLQIRAL